MEEIRTGRLPFCKLDVLHRRNLEKILPRFKIAGLPEDSDAPSQSGLAPARRLAGFRAGPGAAEEASA